MLFYGATENDWRKRGCCTNCSHKDEGKARPTKKKK